jgi:leucyl-tRNA synthetase
VGAYTAETARRSEVERMAEAGEKTGIFTGGYALHPLNGERLPVWIADYVLPGYGTGAVMAVPAHDDRDLAFARKYGLPVRRVIVPEASASGGEVREATRVVVLSPGPFTVWRGVGLSRSPRTRCTQSGQAVQYRMRLLISRQRYWGTPIPIVHARSTGR